jgi:uncharacterized protein YndB with AHSA1/START domain
MVAGRSEQIPMKSKKTAPKNETTLALEGECEVVITRTFNAPPRIVFDVWTKAEYVAQWWAPKSRRVTIVECTADVRAGGAYRYVSQRDEMVVPFSGKYVEVKPYTRLVFTQVFEPMAHVGEALITMTFEDRGAQTHVVSRERYPSRDVREAVIASGMEEGMRECMDQIDELAASLA